MLLGRDKLRKLVGVVLFLLLFSYIIVRAYATSFTHDEALTFQLINGVDRISLTANHHPLNTFLMRITNACFGSSELSLRLPNVLAFGLFFWSIYQLFFKLVKSNFILVFFGFSITVLNPYVLDFFSLARGYGLGLGIAMCSLVYYLRGGKQTETDNEYLVRISTSVGLILLASFANYTYVNFAIVLVGYFCIESVRRWTSRKIEIGSLKYVVGLAIGCLTIFAILISRLFELKDAGELYFGGKNGFIQDTITVLIHRSIYFTYYGEAFWENLLVGIIALGGVVLLYVFYENRNRFLLNLLFLVVALITISEVQFYLFEANFPFQRTALVFIPLFGITVYYFMVSLFDRSNKVVSSLLIVFNCLIIGALGYHFVKNINTNNIREWSYDASTKDVYGVLKELNAETDFSAEWLFNPSLNYYHNRNNELDEFSAVSFSEDPLKTYFYCTRKKMLELKKNEDFITIEEFKNSKTFLLKRVPK